MQINLCTQPLALRELQELLNTAVHLSQAMCTSTLFADLCNGSCHSIIGNLQCQSLPCSATRLWGSRAQLSLGRRQLMIPIPLTKTPAQNLMWVYINLEMELFRNNGHRKPHYLLGYVQDISLTLLCLTWLHVWNHKLYSYKHGTNSLYTPTGWCSVGDHWAPTTHRMQQFVSDMGSVRLHCQKNVFQTEQSHNFLLKETLLQGVEVSHTHLYESYQRHRNNSAFLTRRFAI